MQYFGCITKQDYIDLAEKCTLGIEQIKQDILSAKDEETMEELALMYKTDLDVLEKTYRICRSAYDVLYFTYEYLNQKILLF